MGMWIGALVAIVAAAPSVARGDIIDQENSGPFNTTYDVRPTTLEWQQGVVAGLAGQLVGFEVNVSATGNAEF